MPLFVMRNVKAMVLSDLYLHVQGLVLVGWMVALHTTGLGVPKEDLSTFLRLFGTPYAGAIFNMAMLITFILGLFVSLVVNRWTTIRLAYSKLMGATLDLSMLISSVVQNREDFDDPNTLRARTELTRLLNLGHFLVVSAADAEDREFKPSYGFRKMTKALGLMVHRSFYSKSERQPRTPSDTDDDEFWHKKARNIDFEDLVHEGLINTDEWDLLRETHAEGLPRYQTVYFWAQSLLQQCMKAGYIVHEQQMLKMMLDKLNSIVENASQIFTTLRSQMPYPYVHLVSFVVHMYLFVTTTWFGAFLYSGFPTAETFTTEINGQQIELQKGRLDVSDNYWTAVWCYVFVLLANVMFQGLLDMHSLLDNPFGSHSAKFPLRAHITHLMNATRTMLKRADQLPAAFNDMFSSGQESHMFVQDESERGARSSGPCTPGEPNLKHVASNMSQGFADFLNPPSRKLDEYVQGSTELQKIRSLQNGGTVMVKAADDGAVVDIEPSA